jgi:hypothetical protein
MVAACINADTGVGPSIASGNQVCKPIWADLPIAPIKSKIQIRVIIPTSHPKNIIVNLIKNGTNGKIILKSRVLNVKKIADIPITKAKSAIRFTINAFMAALFA